MQIDLLVSLEALISVVNHVTLLSPDSGIFTLFLNFKRTFRSFDILYRIHEPLVFRSCFLQYPLNKNGYFYKITFEAAECLCYLLIKFSEEY